MPLRSILVVDDSDADQFLAKMCINSFDPAIELIVAFDGQGALEKLAATSTAPDLILLDVNMPVMNGHEFLAEYNKLPTAASTVVMLSTSRQEKDVERACRYDFVVDYLVKPLSAGTLQKLAALLDS